MALVDPKWTCEACGAVQRIEGEDVRAVERMRIRLKDRCKAEGHIGKPYYTAGVRL